MVGREAALPQRGVPPLLAHGPQGSGGAGLQRDHIARASTLAARWIGLAGSAAAEVGGRATRTGLASRSSRLLLGPASHAVSHPVRAGPLVVPRWTCSFGAGAGGDEDTAADGLGGFHQLRRLLRHSQGIPLDPQVPPADALLGPVPRQPQAELHLHWGRLCAEVQGGGIRVPPDNAGARYSSKVAAGRLVAHVGHAHGPAGETEATSLTSACSGGHPCV